MWCQRRREYVPGRRRTQWRKNTVHRDYHIAIDRHFYSVPYQYVGKEVDVRLRGSVIDVVVKRADWTPIGVVTR